MITLSRREINRPDKFRKDMRATRDDQRAFLSTVPPSLPGNKGLWKGVKLLGTGTYGQVGLFEYVI